MKKIVLFLTFSFVATGYAAPEERTDLHLNGRITYPVRPEDVFLFGRIILLNGKPSIEREIENIKNGLEVPLRIEQSSYNKIRNLFLSVRGLLYINKIMLTYHDEKPNR